MEYFLSMNYNFSMTVKEYADYLSSVLDISSFDDYSMNGIQIGGDDRDINKVAFAVDATLETITKASEAAADMLVVHHGLFWGEPIAITGNHYKRVRKALDSSLFLFAAHLPLDAHSSLGNNAQMALRLGMKEWDPFGYCKGKLIGIKGSLPFPMTIEEVSLLLGFDSSAFSLQGAKKKSETVGIISGGGSSDVHDAIKEGLDLYITGEFLHQDYPDALESGISVLAGGHYRSEVFGVRALQRMTEKELSLDTVFIDAESGL